MKHINSFVVAGMVLVVSANSSFALDCNALLEHGLRNISRSYSSEAALTTKYYNHCFKDFKSMSDSQFASVEVEVFGYGGGSGSYSRAQREERLTQWCKQSQETAKLNRKSYDETQYIYSDAVSAWQNCNTLSSSAVQIEPNISSDNKTVDISLHYTGGGEKGVQFMGVDTEGYQCKVKIPSPEGLKDFDPAKTTYVERQRIKIRCLREKSAKEVIDGTTYQVVERGTIAVKTADTDLNLFFTREMNPPLPAQEAARIKAKIEDLGKRVLPLGTIVASVLDWGQFQSSVEDATHWIPADGRDVPSDSKYGKAFPGQNAPDLRGMFIRGLNAFESGKDRKDGKQDPDSRVVGNYQEDRFEEHAHTWLANPAAPFGGPSDRAVNGGSGAADFRYDTSVAGKGKETRPKNVAVFYYMRVN